MKIIDTKDINELEKYIGKELFERQSSSRHLCVTVGESAYFMAFYWCDIRNVQESEKRICIFCDNDEIVFAGDRALCEKLTGTLPGDMKPFRMLAEFFFGLTAGDVDALEGIENGINELEDTLLTSKVQLQEMGCSIICLRKSLLKIKRYYEQLTMTVDRLTENENSCIPESETKLFAAVGRRVSRLMESTVHLIERIIQVREAYQAQIDIEQNQIMKIFTVITAIFLPLTLIVGWYGMNFSMPEYGWSFGYIYVIAFSLVICAVCFIVFKKKKWF